MMKLIRRDYVSAPYLWTLMNDVIAELAPCGVSVNRDEGPGLASVLLDLGHPEDRSQYVARAFVRGVVKSPERVFITCAPEVSS